MDWHDAYDRPDSPLARRLVAVQTQVKVARDYDRQWPSEPDAGFGVGAHRFRGEPQPLAAGERMFTFIKPRAQGKD